MDVAVTELRAQLSSWIDRARAGEDVLITERGIPVARLTAVEFTPLLERLTAEGVIAAPLAPTRPKASGRKRARASQSASDVVGDQRR